MKIGFFGAKSYERPFFEVASAASGFEIEYFEENLTRESAQLARGCVAVCVFVNNRVTQDVIDAVCKEKVGLIALRSAGYNHVDLEAAKGKIKVVRVPCYSPYSVAEHAVGLMLCLNRKIVVAHERILKSDFTIAGLMGFDMHGKTVGVIGCGNIGRAAIAILKGFGMRVLGYDIEPSQVEKAGGIFADLEGLYRESDVISLHCGLTKENHHMVDRRAIAQMKRGVMIINTGRGGLIDSEALIEGLQSGHVGAAGLDVYENEASIFYQDMSRVGISDKVLQKLRTLPNVLITAHQAFFTTEAMQNIARTTLENIKAFAEGRLENEVII